MKLSKLVMLMMLGVLTACSGSDRPTYSGHQESTEGVPGFKDGKKLSPHVKLGQSYTINGKTYVPRMQPDYVEEGMASWYGPGFHGGKTANGERFDSAELTAAHRTLPLPSIVRVTMLSTGKQVVVRVNDRGPFAHSRIIDISRGAAEKIGLLRAGVAKVHVEYMKDESETFAELLADGRDPKSIDIEREVLNISRAAAPTPYTQTSAQAPSATVVAANSDWDSIVAPDEAVTQQDIPTIAADDEIGVVSNTSAPVPEVAAAELTNPSSALPATSNRNASSSSPFEALDAAEPASSTPNAAAAQVASLTPAARTPAPVAATNSGVYVQIGAFQNEANAERLRSKFPGMNDLRVEQKTNASGQTLFHVRMGPYSSSQESNKAFKQLQDAGAEAKIVKE